jgi:hypothetical protein
MIAIGIMVVLVWSVYALRPPHADFAVARSSLSSGPALNALPTISLPDPSPWQARIAALAPSPTPAAVPASQFLGPGNLSVPPPPGTWCAPPGPWQPAFVLLSFAVTGEAPGTSSNTVTISWSATDRCPPYTGYLKAMWATGDPHSPFGGAGWDITALSGTITQQLDCATVPHPVQVTYTFMLLDRASVGVPSKSAQAFVC